MSAPLDQVRLGVVGLRNIGRAHLAQAAGLPGVRVTAVADTDGERRASAQAEFRVPHAFQDAQALFDHPEVDAVVLAVPTHLHEPLTVAALEAGKHVLVEKPIAHSADAARRMLRARDAAERVLMVGMNLRFIPGFAALKAALDAGATGDLQYVQAQWTRQRFSVLWQRGDWGGRRALAGGGPLLDLGSHKLDQALSLLDFPPVLSVDGATFAGIGAAQAEAQGRVYELEDLGVGLVRLAGGRSISLEASYFQHTPGAETQALWLYGTRGAAAVLDFEPKLFVDTPDGLVERPLDPLADAPRTAVEHFVRVLRGQENLSSTAEQGLTVLRVIEGLYTSAERGEAVRLDAPAAPHEPV